MSSPRIDNVHHLLIVMLVVAYADREPPGAQVRATSDKDSTGIIFNKVKTVILADTYEQALFLLPFPVLETAITANLQNATDIITEYWNAIPGDCPELQDRALPDHQAEELINVATDAYAKAQVDLENMKKEISQ